MSASPVAEPNTASEHAREGDVAREDAAASRDSNVHAEPVAPQGPSHTVKARSLAAGQVNRIVEDALPEGISVSRDARVALQKCATISLLYLACLADAERKAAGSSRTTLNVQDIRAALEAAGMAHLVPLMTTAPKRSRD
ncbi:hypothetical protein ABB37_01242 [Leptomonas pyrrhocoris]|uniref:Transcription factor CBF/NF-Y/archaeal histone domain-containing protein n=1 Tax=Leptomonas pyrrhocoris TaxID=157538 RepID=A0A0M9G8N2_LEPPY|nr:hypothetical protein ABB37_01242 [Leptomonas pyrrhocoris]XP_015663188.1 hypothetical protein ABB37_01242 [Leptomonas pyrrhocoris]KPA84748.1 hypothetical protein ABB37_01242 [Leptomonas pyrrhocoris]KPA84749.1 hypothetical protein ABB37_01242 [Leptomonas pyrrhocoris]|eukprot:XP_015663187.1 hypothetical protein ABB37_01242 [Leptomonas pyrrhocoris]